MKIKSTVHPFLLLLTILSDVTNALNGDSYIPFRECFDMVKQNCADIDMGGLLENKYYENNYCFLRLLDAKSRLDLSLQCDNALFPPGSTLPRDPAYISKTCVKDLEARCPTPMHYDECLKDRSRTSAICRTADYLVLPPDWGTLSVILLAIGYLGAWLFYAWVAVHVTKFLFSEMNFEPNKIQFIIAVCLALSIPTIAMLALLFFVVRRAINGNTTVESSGDLDLAAYTAVPLRVV